MPALVAGGWAGRGPSPRDGGRGLDEPEPGAVAPVPVELRDRGDLDRGRNRTGGLEFVGKGGVDPGEVLQDVHADGQRARKPGMAGILSSGAGGSSAPARRASTVAMR